MKTSTAPDASNIWRALSESPREGIGKGGKDVGKGVKKAVDPKSDSADPEKK
jgi:hypothetical protein